MSVQEAWNRQSVWSQASDGLKADIARARNRILGLSIAGAVLANLAVVFGLESVPGKVLTGLGAFVVGAAGLVRSRGSIKPVQEWTRSRSVSEAYKSEVYRYLTHSDDYAKDEPDARLKRELETVERQAFDLEHYTAKLKARERKPPRASDADSYVKERVAPQIEWYSGKASGLRRHIGQLGRVQFGVGLLGFAVAAVAGATEWEMVAIWVPVVTTLAAAVAARAAAERYEYLLVEYERTAFELKSLRANAKDDSDFVKRCEDVISSQNEGWMAKFAGPADETEA